MSRGLPFAANPLLQVRLPAFRSRLVMLLIAIAFVALAARAIHLQVLHNDFLQRQGEVRYGRTLELPASRGKMLDRTGIVLASSLPARAIWAESRLWASQIAARVSERRTLIFVCRSGRRARGRLSM